MDTKIPPGKARFLYFLYQLQPILDKAAIAENPALVVYQENTRTHLFMLEALTRLYKKVQNKKKFTKLNAFFKEMEDLLGAIDFYDGFHKQLANQKNMPEQITNYLQKEMDKKLKKLNHHLKEGNWLRKNNNAVMKVVKKINEIHWPDEQKDTFEIRQVYTDYINKITKTYQVNKLDFKDVEADVHELRRELRWLSIYPQALRGLMQFNTDDHNEPQDVLKKYLTPEIVNSSYNVMPDGSSLSQHILLNKNYFYSLSWMIDALGKLKDEGLTITAIEEGLKASYNISTGSEQLAYSICPDTQMKISEVLAQSQKIAITFFEEKNLEKILSHI